MSSLTLSELFIYPIKSVAGISVEAAKLTPRGLECDRLFMLTAPEGHFITQRRFPKMALIEAHPVAPGEIAISAPKMPALHVSMSDKTDSKTDGKCATEEVDVWGDRVSALSCGPEAADWFSQFLQTPCQLVYLPPSSKRPTDHGKFGPSEIVSFADAYPYLLLSEASLHQLNEKLTDKNEAPVTMNRFRPNLVIKGDISPHAEDDWKRIRIGDAIFKVAKPCSRCSIPNVNQEIGSRTNEPSRTLATYRAWDKEIWFGQNLIQENPGSGRLQLGDAVEILA